MSNLHEQDNLQGTPLLFRTADKILDFGKDLGRVHQGRKADKARDAYHMHHAGSDYKDLLIDPAFLIID